MDMKEVLDKIARSERDFSFEDLSRMDLAGLDFTGANFKGAKLTDADFTDVNLTGADLTGANFTGADLTGANLTEADLTGANFTGAKLTEADLTDTNLSGSKGLTSQIDWIEQNGEEHPDGYVFYKMFGLYRNPPDNWEVREGAILTETVNFDRTTDCACGVNIATKKWVSRQLGRPGNTWRVLIEFRWLAGVCVPYNTDGKIRCERCQVLDEVSC